MSYAYLHYLAIIVCIIILIVGACIDSFVCLHAHLYADDCIQLNNISVTYIRVLH